MKRIVFTAPRTAELLDAEKPSCPAGYLLVKLVRSSISSGTERANVSGSAMVSPVGEPNVPFPRCSGYSSVGIVEEVGEGVKGFEVGDRVSMSWSTHSQYHLTHASLAYKLPDCVDDSAAALVHICTFPMAAVRKVKLELGESAIVMGLGVLGLIAIRILRIAGAAPIIAVDPNPERREQALKFGADFALDPFAEGFTEQVKSLTNGGVKCAIEVTGNGKALDQVLDCMARFGRVALLGCTRDSNFTIDYYRKVHNPGITLVGAHTNARPLHESSDGWWTQRDDANAIIKLIELGRLNLSQMVEDIVSPLDCGAIYTRLCDDKSFPITQFDWNTLE